MDQNNIENNDLEQSIQTAPDTTISQPIKPTAQPKTANKVLLVASLSILALFIISAASFFTYSYFNSVSNKENNVVKNDDTKTSETIINPAVEAANSILTGSSISESSLTSTDDSSALDESINATENLGESIDENNF